MHAANNRQSPRKANSAGESQGLRPEFQRVGQGLRTLGGQRREPELRRQMSIKKRADENAAAPEVRSAPETTSPAARARRAVSAAIAGMKRPRERPDLIND